MLGLKLFHISKRGPWYNQQCRFTGPNLSYNYPMGSKSMTLNSLTINFTEWKRWWLQSMIQKLYYITTFKLPNVANAFLSRHSGGPIARKSEAVEGISFICWNQDAWFSWIGGQNVMSEWLLTLMGLLPDTPICRLCMRRECRERFPCHRLQRKPLVSDPGMHHGTCVTHVPWCMSGSLTRCGGENVPGIPVACATHNIAYLARGPLQGDKRCDRRRAPLRHRLVPASNRMSPFSLRNLEISVKYFMQNPNTNLVVSMISLSDHQLLINLHMK